MKKIVLLASAALVVTGAFADRTHGSTPKSKVSMSGTWLLNGKDKNTRFVFGKDGTFAYSGWGATSKGKWAFDGSNVRLTWTEIDKQKVSGRVQGKYPVLPSGELKIDNYRYRRSN